MGMAVEDIGRSPDGSGSREPSPSVSAVPASIPNAALRVVDYVNEADAAEVARSYAAAYPHDPDVLDFAEHFARFKAALNRKIGISRTDGMRVVLRHVHEDWSNHSGCGDDEDYIDVGGANVEASNWSLSFTPWGEWKLLPVEDLSGKSLSTAEVAAHIFYEMTWHGSEEEAVGRWADVLDAAERVGRELTASGTDARSGETEGLDPKDDGPVPEADAK